MSANSIYYVYSYLRADGSPYYIGKGKGLRYKAPHGKLPVPPSDRIVFIEDNLTEEEAFDLEVELIAFYGRKDNGTGILRNRTDGGEGRSGGVVSESERLARSSRFREAMLLKWQDAEYRSEQYQIKKERMKDRWKDEEYRAKMSSSMSETWQDEHKRASIIDSMKTRWEDESYRQNVSSKVSNTIKNAWATEEYRTVRTQQVNDQWNDPDIRNKMIQGMKNAAKNIPIVECPHCGKKGKGSVMKRWHFDKCKKGA